MKCPTCARCGRRLLREPIWIGGNAIGPKCARAMFGAKPRRVKSEPVRDELTADLFAEVVCAS
jgi:hypothetical protein